ncbi:MAG: right-handed parallel beta-helix repeat-containing protein, partial [Thermocrispum sp.]
AVLVAGAERLAGVFDRVPLLAQACPQRWEIAGYSVDELAEVAVRLLTGRGHDVPDDVHIALRDQLAAAEEDTVYGAHRLARRLAASAASRTLTVADLEAVTAARRPAAHAEDGLASVG